MTFIFIINLSFSGTKGLVPFPCFHEYKLYKKILPGVVVCVLKPALRSQISKFEAGLYSEFYVRQD